jgi:hypothetical protein
MRNGCVGQDCARATAGAASSGNTPNARRVSLVDIASPWPVRALCRCVLGMAAIAWPRAASPALDRPLRGREDGAACHAATRHADAYE